MFVVTLALIAVLSPAPSADAAVPRPTSVGSCSDSLVSRLSAAMAANALFGNALRPTYSCLRYPGDSFDIVAAYIGDVPASRLPADLPLLGLSPLASTDYEDLTVFFVLPAGIDRRLDPDHVKDIKGAALDWDTVKLEEGLNVIARVNLDKWPGKSLFETVGVKSTDLKKWTVRASVGIDFSAILDLGKPKRDTCAFNAERTASVSLVRAAGIAKMWGVNGAKLSNVGLTFAVAQALGGGAPPQRSVSAEGTLTYKRKAYDLYAHSAGAFALDADDLTLKELLNVSHLAGKMFRTSWSGLAGKLKLPDAVMSAIKFNRRKPACSAMALAFSRKLLAAAKSGDGIPDDIDADCKAAERQANVSFTGRRGLDMKVDLAMLAMGPLSLKDTTFTVMAENPAKPKAKHLARFTGTASVAGVFDGTLHVEAKAGGHAFSVPADCPLQPARGDVLTDGRVRFRTARYRVVTFLKKPSWINLDGIAFAEKGEALALKW